MADQPPKSKHRFLVGENLRIGKWVIFEKTKPTDIAKIFDDIHTDFMRLESLRAFIDEHACPKCGAKKQLHVSDYEIGKKGWEASLRCKKCRSQGVLNNTGFHFKIFDGEESK